MIDPPARKVLFDDEVFIRVRRSGISKYFTELIAQFRADTSLGIEPLTPYRYVSNAHLKEKEPSRYRAIPLPRRTRVPVLRAANARAPAPAADIIHHTLYEPEALERWSAPIRVCTIYDFMLEIKPEIFGPSDVELTNKRLFMDTCDALMCISQTTYDDMHAVHPELDKPAFVTPLAANDSFFDPTPVQIRRLPERYLLHVGNRILQKNVGALFQAFAEVARTDPSLRLVLIGQGLPDEAETIRRCGIEHRVVHLKATDQQLPWIYHQARALVFPSLYEGFGLPLVEALAAGCPTVIADIPVFAEISDGNALMFEPLDIDLLTTHLHTILGDAALRDRLGVQGRKRAANYSWQRTAEKTRHAYTMAAQAVL